MKKYFNRLSSFNKISSFNKLKGMHAFKLMWFGQLISTLGTEMTKFTLLIWAYEQTGRATTSAMLGFCSVIPYVILSPLAGSIVDRYDRKKILIISDLMSGAMTVGMFILLLMGKLEVYHMFIMETLASVFGCFQYPAYSASITVMLDKKDYVKVNGMRSLSGYASTMAAPLLAGILLSIIGIEGVMIIDIITFSFAVLSLTLVCIPVINSSKGNKNLWFKDFIVGFKYLSNKKGLLYLMGFFCIINLISTMTYFGILTPMILARSGNNEMILSIIRTLLGIGGVVGSILVTRYRLRVKKVKIIFLAGALSFIIGDILLASCNTMLWYVGAFASALFIPFISSNNNTLWHINVEPEIQGRVFSIRSMIQQSTSSIGYVIGGILADYIFEPMVGNNSVIIEMMKGYIGNGKGTGMAMMFICTGLFGGVICLLGYKNKAIIALEDESEETISMGA
ncbi:MFS transporter [Oceanirhabdus sp. W0125-5]|uniref:MFS transporter n=1 Tax=Oceanirhabdus sp. W0125-5 TaxID=2999116 RepID=UPI0022F30E41|nr:MFS transporter [Oceanirhabdus sp. W0125-5]WBW97845.1 MFS transporter [Oceanirhabdus sp. W0125-5]